LIAERSQKVENTHTLIEPLHFMTNHGALRPQYAIAYLDWLLQCQYQHRISPDFMSEPQVQIRTQART
jgi:hypothetical protein